MNIKCLTDLIFLINSKLNPLFLKRDNEEILFLLLLFFLNNKRAR